MSTPLTIFCCYARKDQKMLEHLKIHLIPLERQGRITIWSDTDIDAGEEWEKELHQHLETAAIILLLISPDFMASDYCYSTEMTRAIARHNQHTARVIPILLRPVIHWDKAPFAKLQVIPTNANYVTGWADQEEAFHDIALQISKVVDMLLAPVHTLAPQEESVQRENTVKPVEPPRPVDKPSRKRRLVLAGFALGAMVIAIALSFAPFGIFPFSGSHASVRSTPTSSGYPTALQAIQAYCNAVENHNGRVAFDLESSRLQASAYKYTLPAISTDVTKNDYDECMPQPDSSLDEKDPSKAYFLVTFHAIGTTGGTLVFILIDLAGAWKIDDTSCYEEGFSLGYCP